MKYIGSKRRIAKEILPIILKDRKENQWYIEPFCGGCNSLWLVDGNTIGNDINKYLIALWKKLQSGWIPPQRISKEEYYKIKNDINNYPEYLVGWIAFCCSYSGAWFAGYSGDYPEHCRNKRTGKLPNYQTESYNSVLKQIKKMGNVIFLNKNYWEIDYPKNSIIYCDPPYKNTIKYKDNFEHKIFWEWCREMTRKGHTVFISEYNAPEDFECVWKKTLFSQHSITSRGGNNKQSEEKLFIFKK